MSFEFVRSRLNEIFAVSSTASTSRHEDKVAVVLHLTSAQGARIILFLQDLGTNPASKQVTAGHEDLSGSVFQAHDAGGAALLSWSCLRLWPLS